MGTQPTGSDGNYDDGTAEHMFLATFTVPEPGSLLLLGCGVAGLLVRRRARGAN